MGGAVILADVASPDAKFRERSSPSDAIEQHAKHLPLGTDLLLVSAIADALEAAQVPLAMSAITMLIVRVPCR